MKQIKPTPGWTRRITYFLETGKPIGQWMSANGGHRCSRCGVASRVHKVTLLQGIPTCDGCLPFVSKQASLE